MTSHSALSTLSGACDAMTSYSVSGAATAKNQEFLSGPWNATRSRGVSCNHSRDIIWGTFENLEFPKPPSDDLGNVLRAMADLRVAAVIPPD